MSEERVEAVRAIYERLGKGDFRATLDYADPHFLYVLPPGFPESGIYLGIEALGEYTREFLEPWDHIAIEAEEIIDAGDSVVAAVRQSGVGSESGIATEFRYFQVWTFRGPKAIRLEAFRERSEALAAAGVTDPAPD
jgi:ketosteroid isomerase-like protein